MAAVLSDLSVIPPRAPGRLASLLRLARRHRLLAFSAVVFALLVLVALLAPLLLPDPRAMNPVQRLRAPGWEHWFGTDHLGRSVAVRTLYGTRISLAIGVAVAIATTVLGLGIGVAAGFMRRWDGVIMRCMDGVMAIPGVLLAIALMSLFGSDIRTVIVAITIPEIPRMARLVRSLTLAVRSQPYIQAAITNGARLPRLMWRHVIPNLLSPVLVQATYVFASAMILEAVLSFLGAGTPPDIPSWATCWPKAAATSAARPGSSLSRAWRSPRWFCWST